MKKTCGNCGLCGSGSCCYFTAKNCTAWRHDGIPSRAAIRELVREINAIKKIVPHITEQAWGLSDMCDALRPIYEAANKVESQMKGKK